LKEHIPESTEEETAWNIGREEPEKEILNTSDGMWKFLERKKVRK
jgi:hypothetical protein